MSGYFEQIELVKKYYDSDDEENRFKGSWKQVELINTKRFISENFRKGNFVLDCSAGTGIYAEWLCELGYKVAVSDLSSENISKIKKKYGEDKFYSINQCNACDMNIYGSDAFDYVLCLGPLYHLENNYWGQCISECIRVCKKGGYILFAYMPREYMTMEIMFHSKYKCTRDELIRLWREGRVETTVKGFHSCAYFASQEDIKKISDNKDIKVISHFSVDYNIGYFYEKIQGMNDFEINRLSEILYEFGKNNNILASSKHNLVWVKKE